MGLFSIALVYFLLVLSLPEGANLVVAWCGFFWGAEYLSQKFSKVL